MATEQRIDVSVLVPVLDEERYIRAAVADMQAQRFDGEVELIFVDGRSHDATKAILEGLAREDQRIRILDNPDRSTPNGLNVGLRAARGRYVARMDAHTHYPPGYLAAGVERLERGGVEWVSGPQLATGNDGWSRRVALALSTTLGTGGAAFRLALQEEIEVDTGFTGVWRRETLEAYDGWDEGWPVDQDYELAARIRADGGQIVCIPAMAASYIPRDSIRRLARQYWRYGVYRVKTSVAHPRSMRRSHVLAPGLALATALAALPLRRAGAARRAGTPRGGAERIGAGRRSGPLRRLRALAWLGVGIYLLALGAQTVRELGKAPPSDVASLPLVLATMHLSAGFGFLWGCVRFGPPLAAVADVLRPSR